MNDDDDLEATIERYREAFLFFRVVGSATVALVAPPEDEHSLPRVDVLAWVRAGYPIDAPTWSVN